MEDTKNTEAPEVKAESNEAEALKKKVADLEAKMAEAAEAQKTEASAEAFIKKVEEKQAAAKEEERRSRVLKALAEGGVVENIGKVLKSEHDVKAFLGRLQAGQVDESEAAVLAAAVKTANALPPDNSQPVSTPSAVTEASKDENAELTAAQFMQKHIAKLTSEDPYDEEANKIKKEYHAKLDKEAPPGIGTGS